MGPSSSEIKLTLKTLDFQVKFDEMCYLGFDWQQVSIVKYNGSKLNRQQTMIWTNEA